MLPLLVTLVLGWTEPVDLVRDLSSDSIQVRERAARELHRRGRELRPFLIDALVDAVEPETRARLEDVLARLAADERIRYFGGSNRVGGFGLSLRSDRFYGSGPFRLTVEVMNLGSTDEIFPGIHGWDLELPDQELKATGSEARITVRRSGGPLGLRRTSWGSGDRTSMPPAYLKPGDSARFEVVLDARALSTGDYQVTLEYFAREALPAAEENLRSNQVHLTIRK